MNCNIVTFIVKGSLVEIPNIAGIDMKANYAAICNQLMTALSAEEILKLIIVLMSQGPLGSLPYSQWPSKHCANIYCGLAF